MAMLMAMAVIAAVAACVDSRHLHLSSFAYTAPAGGGAAMWTADDWLTSSSSSTAGSPPSLSTQAQVPWQSLILQTGTDTVFANLSAAIYAKTSVNVPVLWYWGGWLQYGGNVSGLTAAAAAATAKCEASSVDLRVFKRPAVCLRLNQLCSVLGVVAGSSPFAVPTVQRTDLRNTPLPPTNTRRPLQWRHLGIHMLRGRKS